jgi:hypothetical protein
VATAKTKSKKKKLQLQRYPRLKDLYGGYLSEPSLYTFPAPIAAEHLIGSIDGAFQRCQKNKEGEAKENAPTPQVLVARCLKHLRERSDPILNPYFVAAVKPEELFALDAVSHEMQRRRMDIGIFYQYLLLDLMQRRWQAFDGAGDSDTWLDIDDTPNFPSGLRIYMSVKKSADTVGGQDVGSMIERLEQLATDEKNLNRPYLCVVAIATPTRGRISTKEADRRIKFNKAGHPYSPNCEFWGPGFLFPFICGRPAKEVYALGISRIADHLPFYTLRFKDECSQLLRAELKLLGLLSAEGRIEQSKFLDYCVTESEAAVNDETADE